jgi:hypothetical protein
MVTRAHQSVAVGFLLERWSAAVTQSVNDAIAIISTQWLPTGVTGVSIKGRSLTPAVAPVIRPPNHLEIDRITIELTIGVGDAIPPANYIPLSTCNINIRRSEAIISVSGGKLQMEPSKVASDVDPATPSPTRDAGLDALRRIWSYSDASVTEFVTKLEPLIPLGIKDSCGLALLRAFPPIDLNQLFPNIVFKGPMTVELACRDTIIAIYPRGGSEIQKGKCPETNPEIQIWGGVATARRPGTLPIVTSGLDRNIASNYRANPVPSSLGDVMLYVPEPGLNEIIGHKSSISHSSTTTISVGPIDFTATLYAETSVSGRAAVDGSGPIISALTSSHFQLELSAESNFKLFHVEYGRVGADTQLNFTLTTSASGIGPALWFVPEVSAGQDLTIHFTTRALYFFPWDRIVEWVLNTVVAPTIATLLGGTVAKASWKCQQSSTIFGTPSSAALGGASPSVVGFAKSPAGQPEAMTMAIRYLHA